MSTSDMILTIGMLLMFAVFVGLLAYDLFWKWPRKQRIWDAEYAKFKAAMLEAALPKKVYVLLGDDGKPSSFTSTEVEAGLVTGVTGLTYVAVERAKS